MRIDVLFGVGSVTPSLINGRVVGVIDVLRASTTIAVALANGAKSVIPMESAEAASTRAKQFDRTEVRLAGEHKMVAIPGFDLGNSPREFTREAVDGKTVLITTTNGTGVLMAIQGARDVVVASYVNLTAVLALLRTAARAGTDIALVCAGRDRQFSLEDAACAGRYIAGVRQQISEIELGDGALASTMLNNHFGGDLVHLFATGEHGRALTDAGFGADLELCAAVDSYPVIPVYQERQITLLGPDRER